MAVIVLIVEDEILIAWHLQELIEQAGHRVLAIARTPDEAYAAATRERPDFALLDIRLEGGTSGLEAGRLLYERFGVRSIFLSANLDAATRREAQQLKPYAFIGKPFFAAEVLSVVAAACEELRERKRG